MNVLAIKTDQPTAEVYVYRAGSLVTKKIWQADRQLSAELLENLRFCLKQAKLSFADLDGVVIFNGSGSFTGLRIGISVANSLAYGLGIPISDGFGSNWLLEGLSSLPKVSVGQPVMPVYDRPVHITKQKK
jgi:tRNA threonylcarbamoyladenosine biosynthesis protein TsaB